MEDKNLKWEFNDQSKYSWFFLANAFCERVCLVEEFVWWKSLFGERVCLVEKFVWWKSLFGERVCLVEEFVLWKSLFGGRVCLVLLGKFVTPQLNSMTWKYNKQLLQSCRKE